MPKIIPIKELKNTGNISELCHSSCEPIFVTKNGFNDMVVMSDEVYNQIMGKIRLYHIVSEAEEDIEQNNLIDSNSVFSELRGKYGYR